MEEAIKAKPAIWAKGIQFSYSGLALDQRSVLFGINLVVSAGEWTGVIGPSGCGKSTLLKLVAGLEKAQSGTLLVLGEAPHRVIGARRIGAAFQEQALVPWLSAQRNVELPVRGDGTAALSEAQKLLTAFGLGHHLGSLPTELSGGMRARVALARALIHSPDLVLLDEPFSSLDEITAVEVCRELLKLRKTGPQSLLIISHNLEAVARLADKCLCLGSGHNNLPEMVDLRQFGHPQERTEAQIREARAALLSRYL